MSYQVIARKWRPRSFDELVGQNHVTQTLMNALRNDRLPHALIFSGARGVGKTSSARILAKSLRCPNAQNFVPCNQCKVCEEVAGGSSLDVIEIDGASNNGVDAIRELRETVGYMPSSGRYKVYIIDEVHMLSTSAFNALLKTLEEPPAHVVFIFATTEPQKIPVTILSRCQRFDFRRISTREISEKLGQICVAENITVEPEALWSIARQAEGSMRDSQSLLDQVITFGQGQITTQTVIEVLGLTDRALLIETLKALVDRDTPAMLALIEKIFVAGYDAKTFAHDLLEEVRHLLIVKLTGEKSRDIVDLPETEARALAKLGSGLSEEDIHLLFDMALKGGSDIPRSQTPHLVLEMMLLRMAAAPRIVDLARAFRSGAPSGSAGGAADRPSQKVTPQTSQATGVKATQAQPPAGAAANGSLVKATPQERRWNEFVERIQEVQPSLGARLEHVFIVSMTDKDLILGLKKGQEFNYTTLSDKSVLEKLGKFLQTYWGVTLTVQLQLVKEAPAHLLSPREEAQKKQVEAEESLKLQIENSPLVKQTQSVFKTQIREIKELS